MNLKLDSSDDYLVSTFNSTSGLVQFPQGDDANAASPKGMNTVANILQAAGKTTAVTCVADSAATPAYLGFTYSGTAAGSGVVGSTNFTINRIVDPSGLFGICKQGATGFVIGSGSEGGGTCAVVPTASTDGYP